MDAPQAAPARTDAPLAAIALLATGVTVFVIQDVIVKSLSGAYPVHQMLFIRSVTGLLPLLVFGWLRHGAAAFRVRTAAVARGTVHFVSYTVYYLALAALPLAEVSTLYYAAPLFITALSVPFLGEAVGWRRWLAVLVGFAGVVIVLRPGAAPVDPAMLLALGSALLYAVSMLITRKAGGDIPAVGFVLHSMVILSLLAAVSGLVIGDGRFDEGGHASAAFLLRAWSWPGWGDLGLLAATGPISALAFMLLTQAYRIAPASLVTPFEYSSLPVAVLFGFLFFGDLPAGHTWAGLAFIVGAGLYIVHREAVRGRRIVRGWPPMRPRL